MRPLFTAFVVFVFGFVLASCGSDSGGPDVDSTPSASPTPTLSPPTKPANLHEATPESAADFVNYWIQVLNFAHATGDLKELRLVSKADCEGCNVAIEMIAEVYGAGGHVSGNAWSTDELELKVESTAIFVTMTVSAAHGELVNAKGQEPVILEAMESKLYAWVQRDAGQWLMSEIGSELDE